MIDKTEKLFKKLDTRFKNIIETDEFAQLFVETIKMGENQFYQTSKVAIKKFDRKFIDTLEGFFPHLDQVVRDPKRFIRTFHEVVDIEKAKKTDQSSVKHLAANSHLVRSFEHGVIQPKRIQTVMSEDEFGIYENRFIKTLIEKLFTFIEKRYQLIKEQMNVASERHFKVDSNIATGPSKVRFALEIDMTDTISEDDVETENMILFERLEMLRQMVIAFRGSKFMDNVKNAKTIVPPIMQTNIMMMEPNYKKCYELWQYIDTYENLGFSLEIEEKIENFSDEYIQEIYNTILLAYATVKNNQRRAFKLDSYSDIKSRKRVSKPKVTKKFKYARNEFGDIIEVEEVARLTDKQRAAMDKKIDKEKERISAQKIKELEKVKLAKEKEKEKAKLEKEKEREKAKIAAQKEKEKEKARLAKEKEREKAKLAALKEREKEKEKLTKEKEKEKARIAAETAKEAEKLHLAKEAEKARIAAEKEKEAEKLHLAKEAEKARIAAEKEKEAEKLHLAKEAEKARIAAEKAKEAEKLHLAKEAEKARIAAEKAKEVEKARIAAEKAKEAEKLHLAKEADKAKSGPKPVIVVDPSTGEKKVVMKTPKPAAPKKPNLTPEQKEKAKLAEQAAKEKEKEKQRLLALKAKDKEKERLAKEREKEKLRLAKEKELLRETEKLAKEKEKEAEKLRLEKEKLEEKVRLTKELAEERRLERARKAEEKAAQRALEQALVETEPSTVPSDETFPNVTMDELMTQANEEIDSSNDEQIPVKVDQLVVEEDVTEEPTQENATMTQLVVETPVLTNEELKSITVVENTKTEAIIIDEDEPVVLEQVVPISQMIEEKLIHEVDKSEHEAVTFFAFDLGLDRPAPKSPSKTDVSKQKPKGDKAKEEFKTQRNYFFEDGQQVKPSTLGVEAKKPIFVDSKIPFSTPGREAPSIYEILNDDDVEYMTDIELELPAMEPEEKKLSRQEQKILKLRQKLEKMIDKTSQK